MEADYLRYIILGLIQGLTEFLPVSSSSHLILIPQLIGWQDQGLAMDVAAHVGTLCAVIYYFRNELQQMLGSWLNSRFSFEDKQSRYLWYLIIATFPIAIVGLVTSNIVELYLRDPLVIAGATILFALLLWGTDFYGKQNRHEDGLVWKDILVIGLFQVLALIPGTSRSGITITAGLLLGLDRESAARFAFLLSIPTIILAGSHVGIKLIAIPADVDWFAVMLVTLTSFFTAALTIHFFIKFLKYTGMLPYVIYRLILGVFLLYLFI